MTVVVATLLDEALEVEVVILTHRMQEMNLVQLAWTQRILNRLFENL
jgi:hypothetical protein